MAHSVLLFCADSARYRVIEIPALCLNQLGARMMQG